MAKRAVPVRLPNGEVIRADLASDSAANVPSKTFDLDLDDIKKTVRGVSETFRGAPDDLLPSQIEIEFGLELEVKTGKATSLLAEMSGTATVEVSLAWHGDSPPVVTMGPGPAAERGSTPTDTAGDG